MDPILSLRSSRFQIRVGRCIRYQQISARLLIQFVSLRPCRTCRALPCVRRSPKSEELPSGLIDDSSLGHLSTRCVHVQPHRLVFFLPRHQSPIERNRALNASRIRHYTRARTRPSDYFANISGSALFVPHRRPHLEQGEASGVEG